jgi:hypothetical protein
MSASRGPTLNLGASAIMRDLLHTPSAPEDHRFHDSCDWPFGARLARHDDPAGAAYPRRCNWCTEHDRPTSS